MARLPDRTQIDDLVLRCWEADDVEALHEAVRANVEHLRTRMAWIAFEPLGLAARAELVAQWQRAWEAGGDAVYGLWQHGVVVGGAGLHRRLGPGGLEIGYWVDHRFEGQGIATRASRALTDLAFTEPDVDRVEIHHDVTNGASARVPEKLGFTRLADLAAPTRDQAPADTGRDGVWQVTRAAWDALSP